MAIAADAPNLAGLRMQGDGDADAYVLGALSDAAPSDRAAWLWEGVVALREEEPVPAWAEPWMKSVPGPPSWLDREKLRRGQRFFDRWSYPISISLFCASLPNAYAAREGVQVVARVSQLNDRSGVGRRIGNTGRMLLDVTGRDAFEPMGAGAVRLRRVRLLHATTRQLLLARAGGQEWSTGELGIPINQRDQLGTQLSFTVTVFEAMRALGIRILPSEAEDYLYLWSVIGWHLGMVDPLATQHLAEAESITREIRTETFGQTTEGRELMAILLRDMSARMPGPVKGSAAALVRRLAGAEVAGVLAVPTSPRWEALLEMAARLTAVLSGIPGGWVVLSLPSRLFGRASIRRSIQTTAEPTVQGIGARRAVRRNVHAT